MVQYPKLDGKSDEQCIEWPKGGPLSFPRRAVDLKRAGTGFGWGTSVGNSGGGAIISILGLFRTQ